MFRFLEQILYGDRWLIHHLRYHQEEICSNIYDYFKVELRCLAYCAIKVM